MKIKLKIKGKKGKIYTGGEIYNCPRGTILEVIEDPIESAMGEIVMRTDEIDYPLVTIERGSDEFNNVGLLWGTLNEKYVLQELDVEIVVEKD